MTELERYFISSDHKYAQERMIAYVNERASAAIAELRKKAEAASYPNGCPILGDEK